MLVGLWVENITFSILSFLKLNFSITVLGKTKSYTIVFRADTGNNRKIVNFTYSCFYSRPMKVVSVDSITRSNHFYYSIKLEIVKQHLSHF